LQRAVEVGDRAIEAASHCRLVEQGIHGDIAVVGRGGARSHGG
jgi:hypothetical protein